MLLHYHVHVKKDEPWQPPETHRTGSCVKPVLSEVAEQIPSTLRKMPRLSEPGPLGMRAEHWYDFGSLAGNSNLLVQVIAHTAEAVHLSVLQYLMAGKSHTAGQTHRWTHKPLLMMSFLRRLALKSVMAAKKDPVAKCAGPLQYGVGRPDGANTMIKTTQYLAEADNSRVLAALVLKAAFQNVSRRAMLYSIEQNDADPILRSVLADTCRQRDTGVKLFAYLDDWYLWIKPQCLLPISSFSPPKYRSGVSCARTQFLLSYKTKSDSHSAVWERHLQIHGDIEPSLVVLGEQTSMEKTTQRFLITATTLADLSAEGLNAQSVNDPLTMYVGAASQHVLRMSFVPEQEAHNFDRQVTTFWSHLIQRDVTSPLFFLPLKLGGLGVG